MNPIQFRWPEKTAAAMALLATLLAAGWVYASNRDGLWQAVNQHCLQDSNDQSVCPKRADNYVLVKTNQTPPHFLVVPNTLLSGIEAPAFWTAEPGNYFRAAWLERPYAAAHLAGGVALSRVGIAINSAQHRTQDQLHVHINCVNPQVLAELEQQQGQIGEQWQDLRLNSVGEVYRARRMADNEVPADLFSQLLARYPQLADARGAQTAFAASLNFRDGGWRVVVLEGEYRAGDAAYPGHAEDLLSNDCS